MEGGMLLVQRWYDERWCVLTHHAYMCWVDAVRRRCLFPK